MGRINQYPIDTTFHTNHLLTTRYGDAKLKLNTNPHDLYAEIAQSIRSATITKTIDDELTRATHHWVSNTLPTEAVEALAHIGRKRATELWVHAGKPEPEKTTAEVLTPEVINEYAGMREEFKRNSARYHAGIGRKGIIR